MILHTLITELLGNKGKKNIPDGYTTDDIRLYWKPPQMKAVKVANESKSMASFDVVNLNINETVANLTSGPSLSHPAKGVAKRGGGGDLYKIRRGDPYDFWVCTSPSPNKSWLRLCIPPLLPIWPIVDSG